MSHNIFENNNQATNVKYTFFVNLRLIFQSYSRKTLYNLKHIHVSGLENVDLLFKFISCYEMCFLLKDKKYENDPYRGKKLLSVAGLKYVLNIFIPLAKALLIYFKLLVYNLEDFLKWS